MEFKLIAMRGSRFAAVNWSFFFFTLFFVLDWIPIGVCDNLELNPNCLLDLAVEMQILNG